MDNILVSIIVPVYNVGQYLEQCVDSLINQTYRNLQIVLVDDGSTDDSGKICDRYQAADNRVCVIHKKNGGQASARETGIKVVRGQYVMFIDSDDWLDLQAVEQCIQIVHTTPNVGCVMFSYAKETETATVPMHIMDGNQIFEGKAVRDKIHRRLFGLSREELNHPERMENIASCCMKLYHADYARLGRYYDTKEVGSCEDGLFNIYALAECPKTVYLDKPFYHYRKREDSTVKTYKPNLIQQWGRLFDIMQEYIDSHNLDADYQETLNNRIALSITAIALNKMGDVNATIWNKINYIRAYLWSERYHTAVKKLDMTQLPIAWKGLLLCSRLKMAFAVYYGMTIVQWMLRKGR